jgi:hypothetical protein
MNKPRSFVLIYTFAYALSFVVILNRLYSLISGLLDEFPYEDAAIIWLDTTTHLDPEASAANASNIWQQLMVGGFRKLLIVTLCLPILFCFHRYLYGGLEEVRMAPKLTFRSLRCLIRWFIFAHLSSVVPLFLTLFFYGFLEYSPLPPIFRIVSTLAFCIALYIACWKFPSFLLKLAKKKHQWETLKRS